ncbi:MAG: YkgJ family cysteine cluster protein [Bacteroidetes bacterium]|nr:MAG: YkgJ family cysteine cluster protein [Bacteroidota bacterium]TAE67192.1 MAG: YkgJ family cysteine cluster protein [Bacteroidota bacterium]TAF93978.1 MAG: YkgJ family cysteine cluster protein [Bacteroidota bacterium]
MLLQTQLTIIDELSVTNQQENDAFVAKAKTWNSAELDALMFTLEAEITPQIDCLACGNCCKSLLINVEPDETLEPAKQLGISTAVFEEQFVEKGSSGQMLLNTIPCHFLQAETNACKIYETRFSGCRQFPALDVPNLQQRFFTVFMHYGRCPIIFNVMEAMKKVVLT